MRRRWATCASFVVLLAWATFSIADAAIWSKLKKCAESGFCRRNRATKDPLSVHPYQARGGTIDKDSGGVRFTLHQDGSDVQPLSLLVTRFSDGVFRVLIDDQQPRFKRYKVNDALDSSTFDRARQIIPSADVLIRDQTVHISAGEADLDIELIVPLAPNDFRPYLVRSGHIMVSLNDNGWMRFERQEPKPSPPPTPPPTESQQLDKPTHEHTNDLKSDQDHHDTHSDISDFDSAFDSDYDSAHDFDNDDDNDDDDEQDHYHDETLSNEPPVEKDEQSDEEEYSYTESLDEEEEESVEENDDEYEEPPSDDTPSSEPGAEEDSNQCDGCYEETFKSFKDPKVRGPESIGMQIAFPGAAAVYGIPERTTSFSLPATMHSDMDQRNYSTEPHRMFNLDVYEYELDSPFGTYGSVPFMMSRPLPAKAGNHKYVSGVFWHNAAETYVDIAKHTDAVGTHWYSESGIIDLFLLPGGTSPSAVFRQYRMLTGPPAMPARFSLGYHQCRWNYRDDADTRAVDNAFDTHNLAYDVIWLDIEHTDGKRYFTWDLDKFPDPEKLQRDIAARGRKIVTIIDPHIKRDDGYVIHKQARDAGHYVKKADGETDYEGWCWPGSSSYYDFTNPAVRSAWAAQFTPQNYPHMTEHLHVWNDMNEPSVFNGPEQSMERDLKHYDGWEHRDVHNVYGALVHQATYEGLLQARNRKERPFVLSRAFFAGSQRFGAVWTGDNAATWEHLRSTVPMLLSLQVSHIVFSGADVGGFFGNPETELLVRWYQAAAFQPFFRGHAHLDTARREPWLFGDENTALISAAIRTRYEYIPFWYTLFAESVVESVGGEPAPPMRPLWWHFPDDVGIEECEDEWMVGDSLLIAPVLHPDLSAREVKLPVESSWFDIYGGGKRMVGATVTIPSPKSRMFVFQRGGTIVPKQERRRRSTKSMALDPITLVVALDSNGAAQGSLFCDDGSSFEYQGGQYRARVFKVEGRRLVASEPRGTWAGQVDVERVVLLGLDQDPTTVKTDDGRGLDWARVESSVVIKSPMVSASQGVWHIDF